MISTNLGQEKILFGSSILAGIGALALKQPALLPIAVAMPLYMNQLNLKRSLNDFGLNVGRINEAICQVERQPERPPQMCLQPGQRGSTLICIDGENIFFSAKEKGLEINFPQFFESLCKDAFSVIGPYYYTAIGASKNQQGFLDRIQRLGFEIHAQQIRYYSDKKKNTNIDLLLTTELLAFAEKCHTVVIVSGDSGFAIPAKYAKQMGKRIEVWGFEQNTGLELRNVADRFINLMDVPGLCRKASVRPKKRPFDDKA
ncbi:NYN domain-containing protein [Lusitaniella coriacea LEGE 07157]|uniref:NYN domain-containing protein n=1 Tax=Lusitaniella coriacea LEGE 07157 TaxID=945747 RepID=A0A8J7DXP8_9CYAN|nr:NYN domain-containing protein [Lusitaniella coriacea]MBE9117261.1 NYN domain-containing protein [Lusitaniella coriacea LEGE 07157]